jgi:small conductance mechanosensitive channel
MRDDPDFRPLLLDEAPEFAGVESVGSDAVVVRVTAKTSPEDVTTVARAIRERIKAAFDEAGIALPSPSSAEPAGGTAAGVTGPLTQSPDQRHSGFSDDPDGRP